MLVSLQVQINEAASAKQEQCKQLQIGWRRKGRLRKMHERIPPTEGEQAWWRRGPLAAV